MTYIAGQPYAICDRCGLRVRHREMRKEWTGLLVCEPCWDPRPAYLDPPNIYPEGMPLANARPEQPDVELGDNDVQPGDL